MISVFTERPETSNCEPADAPVATMMTIPRVVCEMYSGFMRDALDMDGGDTIVLDKNANIRPSVLAQVLEFLEIWAAHPEKHDDMLNNNTQLPVNDDESSLSPGSFCPDFLLDFCGKIDCDMRQAVALLKAADFLIIEPLQTLMTRYIVDMAVFLPYDVLSKKICLDTTSQDSQLEP